MTEQQMLSIDDIKTAIKESGVDDDGTYSLTSENNTNSCAVFYQSLAIGWGRQLELKTKIEAEALSSSDLVNPYSVWGWTVQKSDYIYVVYDSEDNDAT